MKIFDWFPTTIVVIAVAIIGIITFKFGKYLMDEYRFSKVIPVRIEATLLNHNYSASTQTTRMAPIIGNNGQVSCAFYTTGDSEKKVTEWDCGKYGRLVSTDKRIYQYAKESAILLIRHSDYDTRIVGMQTNECK